MLATRRSRFNLAVALAAMSAAGTAQAEDEPDISVPDAERFVALYAEACLPERFSFDGTLVHAQKLGWSDRDLHVSDAYMNVMLAARDAHYEAVEEGYEGSMRIAGLKTADAGRIFHLIVVELTGVHLDAVGCHLYDFEATAPIAPETVTGLLDHPLAYRTDGDDPQYSQPADMVVNVVWGPPQNYPRMLDTHLTFIPEGSNLTEVTGFSGLMLKSETSLP